ncbi:hypothetical protein C0993_012578 [Termitomyces sp. T159_Od127]|nr:hypothetical protein C0993_012578 [Termitomyces sp. T159_Od127]
MKSSAASHASSRLSPQSGLFSISSSVSHPISLEVGLEQREFDEVGRENKVSSSLVRFELSPAHIFYSLIEGSGHVRATTAGSLSLDNCHPFVHGKLMLEDPNARSFTPEVLRKAMLQTISHLNELAKEVGITEARLLPFTLFSSLVDFNFAA